MIAFLGPRRAVEVQRAKTRDRADVGAEENDTFCWQRANWRVLKEKAMPPRYGPARRAAARIAAVGGCWMTTRTQATPASPVPASHRGTILVNVRAIGVNPQRHHGGTGSERVARRSCPCRAAEVFGFMGWRGGGQSISHGRR
jgi:hypothetical protein